MIDAIYDLARLKPIHAAVRVLSVPGAPASLALLTPPPAGNASIGIIAGSFNPLTRGHEALATAALDEGVVGSVLLLLPLRAVDKEGVTRASSTDRALVLTEWASHRQGISVALVNRGLFVDHARLVKAAYPNAPLVFVVGYDKIVQIFDGRYYDDREKALRALFALSTIRVAPRDGQGEEALRVLLARDENEGYAAGVAGLPVDEDVDALSSTVVRRAAARGAAWTDLAPVETVRFVEETRPYAPPLRLPNGEEIDRYGLRVALLDAVASGVLATPEPPDFAALCAMAGADSAEGRALRGRLQRMNYTK